MRLDLLIVLLFMGLSMEGSKVLANDLWLTTITRSYHSNQSKDYNEANYGLGFRYKADSPDISTIGGVYKNSYYRQSIFGGWTYTPVKLTAVNLGVLIGGVTGYNKKILPLFVPIVMYQRDNLGVNLIGVPPLSGTQSVLALQFEWRLK
jgi:hypothetical protein